MCGKNGNCGCSKPKPVPKPSCGGCYTEKKNKCCYKPMPVCKPVCCPPPNYTDAMNNCGSNIQCYVYTKPGNTKAGYAKKYGLVTAADVYGCC